MHVVVILTISEVISISSLPDKKLVAVKKNPITFDTTLSFEFGCQNNTCRFSNLAIRYFMCYIQIKYTEKTGLPGNVKMQMEFLYVIKRLF